MTKVFIDGSVGTTGLRIYERLSVRRDLTLITLPEEHRKDPEYRKDAINRSDVSFFCLPDDAAREAAGFVDNPSTAIIDTSTAHRTNSEWAYGFPELKGGAERIASSKRIANPGCHASGFIALVAPLRDAGVLGADAKLSCFSLTGYSGGGKKMIADYENSEKDPLLLAPRAYALSQSHKHLPEMKLICKLENEPIFTPVVAPYYAGMQVSVPIFLSDVGVKKNDICDIFASYYQKGLVHFDGEPSESGFISACALEGKDDMQICLYGNDERITLVSRFDNLGKGASGAAIQNMNILLGVEESTGLNT